MTETNNIANISQLLALFDHLHVSDDILRNTVEESLAEDLNDKRDPLFFTQVAMSHVCLHLFLVSIMFHFVFFLVARGLPSIYLKF